MPTDIILTLMSYFDFIVNSFFNSMENLLYKSVGEVLEEILDLTGIGLPDWAILDISIFELCLGASLFYIALAIIRWLKGASLIG